MVQMWQHVAFEVVTVPPVFQLISIERCTHSAYADTPTACNFLLCRNVNVRFSSAIVVIIIFIHFAVHMHFSPIRLFFSISCVYFSDAKLLWAMIISFSNHLWFFIPSSPFCIRCILTAFWCYTATAFFYSAMLRLKFDSNFRFYSFNRTNNMRVNHCHVDTSDRFNIRTLSEVVFSFNVFNIFHMF